MTYTYSDYITYTDTEERETRLRLYIKEVTDKISASVSKHGNSRSATDLMTLRTQLKMELDELVQTNKQLGGSRAIRVNFRGARG